VKLSKLTSIFDVATLQSGYEATVEMIRLPRVVLPVTIVNGNRFKLRKMQHTLYRVDGSEVALKNIESITNRVGSVDAEVYIDGVPTIGYINDIIERYSLDREEYLQSTLCVSEDEYIASVNNASFVVVGNQYPYFVTPINEANREARFYSIATMIELYGEENLVADDLLASLTMLKCKELIYMNDGSIGLASQYESLHSEMINIYNSNNTNAVNEMV